MNWTLTENFPGQPGNEVWSVLGHFSFCSSIIWIWCFEPKKNGVFCAMHITEVGTSHAMNMSFPVGDTPGGWPAVLHNQVALPAALPEDWGPSPQARGEQGVHCEPRIRRECWGAGPPHHWSRDCQLSHSVVWNVKHWLCVSHHEGWSLLVSLLQISMKLINSIQAEVQKLPI